MLPEKMSQEKRTMLALFLTMAVFLLWRTFFMPPLPPEQPAESAPAAAPGAGESTAAPGSASVPSRSAATPTGPAWLRMPVRQGTEAKDVVVENGLYRIVFSTQGAVVKSWVLKKYTQAEGEPLEVVNAAAGKEVGFPLSLRLEREGLTQRVNEGIYVVEPAVDRFRAPSKLTFEFSDGVVRVRKTFTFDSSYLVEVDTSVSDDRGSVPYEIRWPGGFGDHTVDESAIEQFSQIVYGPSDDPEFEDSVDEEQRITVQMELAGITDRYFAAVFLPAPGRGTVHFLSSPWTPEDWGADGEEKDEDDKPQALEFALVREETDAGPFRLFVGPKDISILRSVTPSLEKVVDFGWFGFLAWPLFEALRYTHDEVVSNWGWAIVLITIVINMLLFPLKYKSLRSSRAMQKLAPRTKALQDRYKQYKFNDPRKQRMQQEMMALYKEHGVNPLGGCLPMLFQMPFFFAFYKVLYAAIELRQAPFVGWIQDLSEYDPLYVLPVAMAASMFLMQKMTPMPTADPAQQRMMMLMPLFMGFFFFRLPSGLVLYWLVGSLVGIVQQMALNRYLPAGQPAPGAKKQITTKR